MKKIAIEIDASSILDDKDMKMLDKIKLVSNIFKCSAEEAVKEKLEEEEKERLEKDLDDDFKCCCKEEEMVISFFQDKDTNCLFILTNKGIIFNNEKDWIEIELPKF